ncbi:MAG: adenosylcobalamin-dependent ribonucleoside-diphosphate reductase [Planctomycetota bacterium]
MKIDRQFTTAGQDPFASVEWAQRTTRITNMDGSVVFEMTDAEVPASWSQLATDIMVSKYFRKAGVPSDGGPNGLPNPSWSKGDEVTTGPEKSAKQVIHRLAGCWRHWGETHGYFDTPDDAQAFYDELCFMMTHQMCAPNSPQWFNTGLHWAYGINGPAQGHWNVDPETGEAKLSDDAYTRPQPHACFIQSVEDDLVGEAGIMDLWTREARLFKYGSGTGTNFSQIRSEDEPLSGGGKSSGLMSFLKIGDRAAGAIKSGGTTRRAAKMVCLDLDHPDIESFVNWKVREEIKVAALVEGMKALANEKASPADPETLGETAKRLNLTLDYDFNGESYQTVSGQNSNNSVRIPNAFFEAVENDADWDLIRRTDGKLAKSINAKNLWDQIGYAAWRCADPGVQYDSTINDWHTCPEAGRINASNPCSEYMFLDNTACNLASLNLLKFYDARKKAFDLERFEAGVTLWTMVLEISVLMAQFPSREIAELSYKYRTLGLGYANSGAMLMQAGIPYDSDRGRAIAGCITSILTGRSYATSALMAKEHGAFPGYADNVSAGGASGGNMLRVMNNHRRAAYGVDRDPKLGKKHALGAYEGLGVPPVPIHEADLTSDDEACSKLSNSDDLLKRARIAWDDAVTWGEEHGYRNAQATVLAPTGTIGLLMDCDTTGVEPDFALVKFKKLAGGGYFKIANQSLKPALRSLGYSEQEAIDILTFVMGTLHLDVPMPNDQTTSFAEWLTDKGLKKAELQTITDALPTVFDLSMALSPWTVGAEAMERLGFAEASTAPGFNLLRELGLNAQEIQALNAKVCGTQTVEGAPHLADEHLPVFDCANTCGPTGKRFIAPSGHIQMMAAAQPFLSGAISKTINLPNDASVEDIQASYRLSWELGIKANALYRDGCKLSQPLNTKLDVDDEEETDLNGEVDEDAVEEALEEVAGEVMETASTAAAIDALKGDREVVEKIVEKIVERPMRRRLPDTRSSKTHKFNVAGHEGYLTVGLYDDGQPGELFITMAKEGSTIGGLMDSLGTAISVALQYGVPVDSLVRKFTHQRFEPAGMTHNREIPFAKSLVDYIFRWMGMEFVAGYREANAPVRPAAEAKPAESANEPKVVITDGGRVSGDKQPERSAVAATNAVKEQARPFGFAAGTKREATAATATPVANPVATPTMEVRPAAASSSSLSDAMSQMQQDAPACDVCGSITVRNGTCYKCLNCGNSMGCS